MKFVMKNKEEILSILSQTEKRIADIRFALTALPEEFELEPLIEIEASTDAARQPPAQQT